MVNPKSLFDLGFGIWDLGFSLLPIITYDGPLMAVAVRDRVAKLIQEGMTQEDAVAATPTADFDAKVTNATR